MKVFIILLSLLTLSDFSSQAPTADSTELSARDTELDTRASGWCTGTKIVTGQAGDDGRSTKIKYPSLSGKVQTCILGRGAQSSAVTAVQHGLNICGAIPKALKEDGNYGPKTEAAVIYVQKQKKVQVDGVWGPKTGAAMEWDAYQLDASGHLYASYCKKATF